jgi:hypothetical protein
MKLRERYQNGSIRRERRKKTGAVWVFLWREKDADGRTVRRKEIIGTVTEFPTKTSALKACEFLRSTINRETSVPRKFGELVAHYTKNELNSKSPYAQQVYTGYIEKWITPKWGNHQSQTCSVGV